ncbi:MAG: shikimate dehydrogenase, partial [Proteobacteria bacterium]|nr:shikimate dehydrogenase [Pseudomonadota bacterium]
SVTIPHKTTVIPFLDGIEEVARKIGAVNTIINDQGRLTGYNTDGTAALRALQEAGIETREKSVLVLGSGGAARALTFTLAMKSPPASLKILGVIPDELSNLVRDLREKTGVKVSGDPLEESVLQRFLPESEILLQTTPVGMHPHSDKTLVPNRLLHSRLQVFEVIYNPRQTRLLRESEARGLTVASGLEMFVYQAADQFKMFTGEEAPLALMRKIVLEKLAL